MLKYFIEREDGMWLVHPGEHMGPAWTRDPFKAWSFDKRERSQEELMKKFYGVFERQLFFGKNEFPNSHIDEIMWPEPSTTGDNILGWLRSEGLMTDVRLTEHECTPDGAFLMKSGNITFVYNPLFDEPYNPRPELMTWEYKP